jgi:hypothetical protein
MNPTVTVQRTPGEPPDSEQAWRADLLHYHACGPTPQSALVRMAYFIDAERKTRPLVYRAFLLQLGSER